MCTIPDACTVERCIEDEGPAAIRITYTSNLAEGLLGGGFAGRRLGRAETLPGVCAYDAKRTVVSPNSCLTQTEILRHENRRIHRILWELI